MSAITTMAVWRPISARIRGLERAAAVHAGFLQVHSGSPYGADRYLQKQCEAIRTEVELFQQSLCSVLSPGAGAAITRFLEDAGKQIEGNEASDAQLVRSILVKLVAFEGELTFHLEDPMEALRSASELAFSHLQRLIVVDSDYREKWKAAYAARETECEKLGGVHLLWHGIWAFKVDAEGERTDLVYQERISQTKVSAAMGMVLTEWKLGKGDIGQAFKEARIQAEQYATGSLAGVELSSHRYLVVVTEKQEDTPGDIVQDGIVYRHINLAVDPLTPSQVSRRRSKPA